MPCAENYTTTGRKFSQYFTLGYVEFTLFQVLSE